MRVMVVGAGGQLAHDVLRALSHLDLIPLRRSDLELTDRPTIARVLAERRPDRVINCAAYNLVDAAEQDAGPAFATNALGVSNLARECGQRDIPLLHFSTDYVFGQAARSAPWRESDAPGPLNQYGVSKLAGEYAVAAACPKHWIVRVSGLFGDQGSRGKGGNFVETMLRLAGDPSRHPLRVVADQIGAPTATADIAAVLEPLLQTEQWGIYHLSAGGSCSWFEFAQTIFAISGLSVPVQAVTSAEFAAPARRPLYSVLDNRKIQALGLAPLRPWQDGLADYLQRRRHRLSS